MTFRVVIAGGGTGGHLFPGIAIAKTLSEKIKSSEIAFAIGNKPIEKEILAPYGYKTVSFKIEGIKGKNPYNIAKALFMIPATLCQAVSFLKNFKPNVVLGMGGYSSGPVCLVAKLMGIATAIHEQNSYPGLTNRILSKVVDKIFISFKESKKFFCHKKTVLTGNPIRKTFFDHFESDYYKNDLFTIFVSGGSQGSTAINDIVTAAACLLKEQGLAFRIIHQSGQNDYEKINVFYKDKNIDATVLPFINDIKEVYEQADIVIARAGASTIFELAAMGKPSILIPLPHAANDHQTENARSIHSCGGAFVLSQSNADKYNISAIIKNLIADKDTLKRMGDSAMTLAKPDAAEQITDGLIELSGDKQ